VRIHHILLCLAIFTFTSLSVRAQVKLKTVVIDAGHGGKDPGAIGSGKTNEKDIALVVALKLGDYITKNFPEVNVVYTRKSDVFLELHERAEIANKTKADLFIAVHVNSSTNADAYGTSCYVLGLHRTEANLEVAKRENAVINLEDDKDKNYEFDPNSPEGHIIMSMKQNAFLDQSIDIASKVENQFENYAKRKSLGVKQAGFYVLYKTTMPSILAEIGFISNAEEEKYLNSVKGQDLIATSLFNAFKDYKIELEGSEGAQFAYEQALMNQSNTVNVTANTKTAETAKSQPVKSEEPPVVKTENTTTVKSEVLPAAESTAVTISSGAKIRKPIENSSGGGKSARETASTSDLEPIKVVGITDTNPFDTMSMATLNKLNSSAKNSNSGKPASNPNTTTSSSTTAPKSTSTSVAATTDVAESNKSSLVPDHKSESGTVFKIQLFALKGELKEYEKVSKLFKVLSAEVLPNGFVRYYGGNVKSAAEAKSLLEVAKGAGYSAAFVAGFKDGKRMTADELKSAGL
jgi:N-acetylmuramoyl-L-alanine amidase